MEEGGKLWRFQESARIGMRLNGFMTQVTMVCFAYVPIVDSRKWRK